MAFGFVGKSKKTTFGKKDIIQKLKLDEISPRKKLKKITPKLTKPIIKPSRWNPFEHKDDMEIYGDTGLTLFDSNKRSGEQTGAFFGM